MTLTSVNNITIIVFTPEYAKRFDSDIKTNQVCPVVYFVSNSLSSADFAKIIMTRLTLDNCFSPIAGFRKGQVFPRENEKFLTMSEIEEFHEKGFNPLKFHDNCFYICDEQIFGAFTENGECIYRLSSYMTYFWTMEFCVLLERVKRFNVLMRIGAITMGDGYFQFPSITKFKFKQPKGITMAPYGCFSTSDLLCYK